MSNVTRTATTTAVTIGATTTAVLATKPERKSATLVNDSDEVIYLALGGTAVMNQGIRLNAAGGSYEVNATNLYTGAISAICASGTKVLCVTQTPA